jgi:hypothetical protein
MDAMKLVAVAVFLSAGAAVYFLVDFKSLTTPPDYNAAIKDAVRLTLSDPDSAKFRNIRQVTLGYCGEVNAKNRFGGYTGFMHFVYMNGTAHFPLPHEIEIVCD